MSSRYRIPSWRSAAPSHEFAALGLRPPRPNVSDYAAPRAKCCHFVAVLDKISRAAVVVPDLPDASSETQIDTEQLDSCWIYWASMKG